MKDKGFIRKEVEKISGIPARRIQFYTDRGFVTPEIENPKGVRGATRRYSRNNLLEFMIIKELSKYHVGLSIIKSVMDFIRKNPWVKLGGPATSILFKLNERSERELRKKSYGVILRPSSRGFKPEATIQPYRISLPDGAFIVEMEESSSAIVVNVSHSALSLIGKIGLE